MITQYTVVQWIFLFYLYSFIGWIYESLYVSIKEKHWVNRGFLLGPFLPLYGCGAVMMLFVSIPFHRSLILTFIAGCIGATALEYVTGVLMESLFKVRYWDYSNRKFNFRGHICLAATMAWGVFTVLLTRVIHKPIEGILFQAPYEVIRVITIVLSIYMVADFTLSFKTAIDLRNVLINMDHIKEEMIRMQKRLDVMIAFAGDSKDTVLQATSQKADELSAILEEKFGQIKEMLPKMQLSDEKKEELAELRIKFGVHKDRRFQLSHMKDFYRNAMIKGNPGMISLKFKEGLDEIKKAVMESRKKK